MRIQYFEIQNFRRLKSVRIDLAEESTIFVGANNSGKTTAMVAFRRFLIDDKFTVMDFLLSHWKKIDCIGEQWTNPDQLDTYSPSLAEWEELLPTMDVWLHVETDEVQRVSHILPTLDWQGGLLGIRLRLEPKKIDDLYQEYCDASNLAKKK
jgi:predicted ATP-dependent endonuclease of OLD family